MRFGVVVAAVLECVIVNCDLSELVSLEGVFLRGTFTSFFLGNNFAFYCVWVGPMAAECLASSSFSLPVYFASFGSMSSFDMCCSLVGTKPLDCIA